MDWSTNTVKPNDNSGWIVQVNNKVNAADMTLYVVCANAELASASQAARMLTLSREHPGTRYPLRMTTHRHRIDGLLPVRGVAPRPPFVHVPA